MRFSGPRTRQLHPLTHPAVPLAHSLGSFSTHSTRSFSVRPAVQCCPLLRCSSYRHTRSHGTQSLTIYSQEHHALNHLSRHARAISLQRGWTDHGPPVEAMAYRKFRRSFRSAAILDMPPPKVCLPRPVLLLSSLQGMYMSAYEKSQKPRWSSQTAARTHTSREERARNERCAV